MVIYIHIGIRYMVVLRYMRHIAYGCIMYTKRLRWVARRFVNGDSHATVVALVAVDPREVQRIIVMRRPTFALLLHRAR